MFDDLNKTTNNQVSAPTPNVSQPISPAPASLPKQTPSQMEDIFADIDKPKKPDVFQPKNMASSGDNLPGADRANTGSKKYFILGAFILALILISVGGYFGYKKIAGMVVSKQNVPTAQETPKVENTDIHTIETPAATDETNSQNSAAEPAAASSTLDSDHDGLTDAEEAQLGTNPNDPDSDHDGLFDREAVNVYGTDPLNPDTDGDGYLDGAEVKSGYNPKGPGKLYEINK